MKFYRNKIVKDNVNEAIMAEIFKSTHNQTRLQSEAWRHENLANASISSSGSDGKYFA